MNPCMSLGRVFPSSGQDLAFREGVGGEGYAKILANASDAKERFLVPLNIVMPSFCC
jgi:hypothetical protein